MESCSGETTMKIMVFGAGGFVASYLIKECLKNGDEVIILNSEKVVNTKKEINKIWQHI